MRVSILALLAGVTLTGAAMAQPKTVPNVKLPPGALTPPGLPPNAKLPPGTITLQPPTAPSAPVRDPDVAMPPAPAGTLVETGIIVEPGPQRLGDVAVDPVGAMYVSYYDGPEASRILKLQKLGPTGTKLWPTALTLGNGVKGGSVVAGNDGFVAVTGGEFVQRYDGAGRPEFPSPVRLGQPSSGGPLAYDGAGGVFVTFLPYPKNQCSLRHIDRTGRMTQSPDFNCYGPSYTEMDLVEDGSGNVIGVTGGAQVIVRKWSPTGAVLWTTTVTSVYGDKTRLKIVSDGKGGAFFTWVDARRRPNATDIFVQAIDGTGKVRWTEGGVELTRDGGRLGQADLAHDGSAGLYASYITQANNAELVRFDGKGSLAWSAPKSLGASRIPRVARDGTGVVFASRIDTDGGDCFKVDRFDSAGTSNLPGGQRTVRQCVHLAAFEPRIIGGQPVVLYTDNRAGYTDVWMWR